MLLELMLLDAHLALPSDMQLPARSRPADLPGPGDSECQLRILVSRAASLPQVPVVGADAQRAASAPVQPPAPFIVLKATRDARHGGAAQAATKVAQRSCDPIWCGVEAV